MAVPRLRSPEQQARREDKKPKAIGPKSFASPHLRTEPAQLMYETYSKAKGFRTHGDAPQSRPMKKWHELSTYDRQAWRVLMGEMITAGGRIPVPVPNEDEVALTICIDNTYVSSPCAVEEIKSPSAKKMLAEMRKEAERINAERQGVRQDKIDEAEEDRERQEQATS